MTTAAISDNSNSKLGELIHGWSIPAGRAWSCPGESVLCRTRCYAKRGFFRMQNVTASHVRNFNFSLTAAFSDWLVSAVHSNFVRVMRVHVAGDFYDVEYVQKWFSIVTRCPQQQFFAYTRSWRVEEMLPELVRLANQPNFSLWWSIDRETGPAPCVRGIRRAYMAIDDVDAENAPDDCDLVFRSQTGTIMKKANGVQVCPPENGVKLREKITCSRCGICWKQKPTQWEHALRQYLDVQPGGEINVPEEVVCLVGAP